ncbi:glycoside hydrolase family 13 protein [Flavobacteriaceae bacterium]|nr:glycoside hydrolase family 13 protein [Flavobacteriaceae bacterium]MDA9294393.1 glycoside hydrolase family 13 protein [Flavobacteriaceae bacterium]
MISIKQLVTVFLFGFFISTSLFAQEIERIEPPNWWVGMNNPSLQILLYGDDIGALTPVISHANVQLKKVQSVENPNYLFLDLLLADDMAATTVNIDLLKGNKIVKRIEYAFLDREAGLTANGFDSSDVMYLITPDRFANGDTSNDEILGMREGLDRSFDSGRHGGDIKGILDNIDYIKELGFTAIWLNPILENDMDTYSYHGYAATDFYKVDARYGTNEEYKKLCQIAQSKGVKIIMDMILNHSGSEHWFVKDPPTSKWINNNNTFKPTSHKRTTHQDPYASEYDKKAFVDGWFVDTMPDLNQREALMATYLIQNTLWWIEYAGINGIRMDTYPYPDKNFMSDWTAAVMDQYPNFNIVGEEWSLNPVVVSFWQRGKVNSNGYVSSLPSVMDFPIQDTFNRSLVAPENWNSGWINVYEMLGNDHLYPDPSNLVIFPDNHDMDRFFTQINYDFDLFKMGMVYFSTLRGIPQFYYGTEILMKNEKEGHGQIRSDFPGGWKGDMINGFTGKGLTTQEQEAKALTTKLLNWRKEKAVIHTGKLMQFAPEDGVYSFFRYNEKETVMIIFNKNDKETAVSLDKYNEIIGDKRNAFDVLNDRRFSLESTLRIPPKTALILEIN